MKKKNETRSTVVTGAGSGLGFATAKMLKQQGWKVFGTIIQSQSDEELKKLGITPIVVDIANYHSTDAARDFVAEKLGDRGLSALINVAGQAGVGSGVIEGVPPERVKIMFDTNITGTLNMIRFFLPLLRQYGPARVVNVSSSGVRVPAVFTSIYSITKYAIEGITNSLRYEMIPFGIQATSIEPGGMKTPMTANSKEAAERTWAYQLPGIKEIYYPKIGKSLDFIDSMIKTASKPEVVAKVIVKALNAKKMKIRYLAGPTVLMMGPMQRILGENRFEALMAKMQKLK
ncbi:MAG: SDR family NAD(P)-dependent oxidoreductase [Acutalibacteraceae bacterium]